MLLYRLTPLCVLIVILGLTGRPDVSSTTGARVSREVTTADQQVSGLSVFHSGVDLVALNVIVTDAQRRFVGGLTQKDFAVYEDGVKQDVSFFAVGRVPLDLAVLLDTSSSMTPNLGQAQRAATGVVEVLKQEDRVTIMEFNDRAEILHPLDGNISAAVADIRRTTARGSTALYNAIYLAITEMVKAQRHAEQIRRQAIVVLSDGEDTVSLVQYDDVMDLAKESGVAIYTIALISPLALQRPWMPKDLTKQPQYVMRSFAQETGARWFVATDVRKLEGIYNVIADELAHQYTLGYTPNNARRDGKYRRVNVRIVERPEMLARTRSGYMAPRPRFGDSSQ